VPFEGETAYMIMNARLIGDPVAPRARNPAITPQVEEIVLRAMARDPEERFQTAAEMKTALDAPEQVELTGRAERLQAPVIWRSRWRSLRLVAISILIPVVLFFLFFLMFSRR
jgi:serine/threonine-protein kinase